MSEPDPNTPPLPDDPSALATHWIQNAIAGRAAALDRVFAALRRHLLRSIALRLGRPVAALDPEVEDIVQGALLEAVRLFPTQRFDDRGSLLRWITTIAMNDVRDLARGRTVRRDVVALRTAMHSVLHDTKQPDPLTEVYTTELERASDLALASLDADDREILLLRDFEGLSAKAIAAHLGLATEVAARARVLRARRRWATRLAMWREGNAT